MKHFISILAVLAATISLGAQNIAVVSPNNTTTICQTLDEAIANATSGSVIYLPGGGFQIKDETVIDKKITIMGVSHRTDTDNADGATMISGNIRFTDGSSGSAVLGVYVTGNINIGVENTSVDNIVIRYCNINSIQISNNTCSGTIVNQNYIRGLSRFNNASANISNNITSGMIGINGGTILNNVFVSSQRTDDYNTRVLNASNSVISSNVFLSYNWYWRSSAKPVVDGNTNQGTNNMTCYDSWGDDCVHLPEDVDWSTVFEKNSGISTTSRYHFIGEYKQYEGKIGIYGGTSFKDDTSLAPIPRIVSKKVAEQTDGTGKLKVEVTVKAQ